MRAKSRQALSLASGQMADVCLPRWAEVQHWCCTLRIHGAKMVSPCLDGNIVHPFPRSVGATILPLAVGVSLVLKHAHRILHDTLRAELLSVM